MDGGARGAMLMGGTTISGGAGFLSGTIGRAGSWVDCEFILTFLTPIVGASSILLV